MASWQCGIPQPYLALRHVRVYVECYFRVSNVFLKPIDLVSFPPSGGSGCLLSSGYRSISRDEKDLFPTNVRRILEYPFSQFEPMIRLSCDDPHVAFIGPGIPTSHRAHFDRFSTANRSQLARNYGDLRERRFVLKGLDQPDSFQSWGCLVPS